jgi:hypothetical protein
MKDHPKYRTHQPGHPHRGFGERRPESLGKPIEQRIRSSINARQRKGECANKAGTGLSRRRGRS